MRKATTLLLSILAVACLADGVVVPGYYFQEPLGPPELRVTIAEHHVTTTIDDGLAVTSVEEVFVNDYDHAIEAVYIFPVPEGAAVSEFSVTVDGREVSAEVLEAAEAAELYADALRQGGNAALLEFMGRGAFRAALGEMAAGERRPVRLEYTELLEPQDGLYHYSYPLDIDTFTYRTVDNLSLEVTIASAAPVLNVYSTSHTLTREELQDGVKVTYYEQNARPAGDFELYYQTSTQELAAALLTHRLEEDGAFLLILSPQRRADDEVLPKDIVFCLDISGSMRGDKLTQAKTALAYCLERLNPADRFEVVTFTTEVESLFGELRPADQDNRSRALEFIAGLEAQARTNIDGALQTSLEALGDPGQRPQSLIFLTDGKPTVGEREPVDIVANVEGRGSSARAYIFGVGHDLNSLLLDHLAVVQRGSVVYVEPGEDLEAAVTSFYEKIQGPVLTDLELDFGGTDVAELYPPILPDLFSGEQLTLSGRFAEPGRRTVTLSGRAGGEILRREFELDFAAVDNPAVELIWARRKVGYLLELVRLEGEDEETVETITELALRFGIVTPYTSLAWAEDDRGEPLADNGGHGHFSGGTAAGDAPSASEMELRAIEGAAGVAASESIDELQAGVGDDESAQVRRAMGRAFYLRDGVWTDSIYDEDSMTPTEVVQASDDYFTLLTEHPELARAFALGDELIVVVAGQAYRISPADAQ